MIGYYVHHHGSGHLARAGAIARECAEPVIGLSSLPEPERPHAFAGWVRLAPDPALPDAADPTGHDLLHWAPTDSSGYAARAGQLVAWCTATRPRLVVVDLSVEVTALVRLAGTPVAVVTLPGHRDDAAHRLAFGLADRVLAPWPQDVYDPPHLRPHAAKTRFVGALSRFDGLPASGAAADSLVALSGTGGGGFAAETVRAAAADRGWRPRLLGGTADPVPAADVHAELARARVVVTHAGTNALAEVAALRRPAVVVPQDRPFGEQHATAHALAAAGLATVLPSVTPHTLAAAVRAAAGLDGSAWRRWNDGSGARRAAAALAEAVPPGATP